MRGYYPNPEKLKTKKELGKTYNIVLNDKKYKNFEYQSTVHNRYSLNYLEKLKSKQNIVGGSKILKSRT